MRRGWLKRGGGGGLSLIYQFITNQTNSECYFTTSCIHVQYYVQLHLKTTFITQIFQLRELNLGTHFPNINDIEIKKLTVNPNNGLIDDLELCLQLEYNGGFQLSTDANMRLNKTARVSVKGKLIFSQFKKPFLSSILLWIH